MDEKTHEPLLSILTSIVETAVKLRKDGHRVVIVSSGAIGVGLRRMDVDKRPKQVSKLQVRLRGEVIMTILLTITGSCCYWPVSPHESMG